MKALELAFEELQDYVKRMAARVTRRDQRETASGDGEVNGATALPSPGRPYKTVYERIRERRHPRGV